MRDAASSSRRGFPSAFLNPKSAIRAPARCFYTVKTAWGSEPLTAAQDDVAVAGAQREDLAAAADAPAAHARLAALTLGHGHAVVEDRLGVGLDGGVRAVGDGERDGADRKSVV